MAHHPIIKYSFQPPTPPPPPSPPLLLLRFCFLITTQKFSIFTSKMAGALNIMRDLCPTSSYFSLEPYWIGCQLCKTNHFLLLLIYLIYVIFVFDLLTPVHFLCTRCPYFDINKWFKNIQSSKNFNTNEKLASKHAHKIKTRQKNSSETTNMQFVFLNEVVILQRVCCIQRKSK